MVRRVAGIACQRWIGCLRASLSAFAAGVAGAHELHQRSADPSAEVLRRGFSIHAGEPAARGAAAEGESRRGRALNLRARSRWRSGAALEIDGGGSAGRRMVL